jgi:hypothetical protein
MNIRVTKAGSASPAYFQLMSTMERAIIQPTCVGALATRWPVEFVIFNSGVQ